MKNKLLLYIAIASGLSFTNEIKPIDFGRLYSGATSAVDDSRAIDAALTDAKTNLNNAKQVMQTKKGPAKERGQIAVSALFKGVSALLLIIIAINKLNDALVEGDVPGLSAKLKDAVKPRLGEVKATALEVQKALNYLQDLIKPSAVAVAAAAAAPVLANTPALAPTSIPQTVTEDFVIPEPRLRGAVVLPAQPSTRKPLMNSIK